MVGRQAQQSPDAGARRAAMSDDDEDAVLRDQRQASIDGRHHAIGAGHEGRVHGCNFAVLFPLWDMVFGTADYRPVVEPTGIRDQLPQPQGAARDYGEGFWAQQWLGLQRIFTSART